MLRMKCRPVHPGKMLREDFLPDYKLTAADFAKAIGVSRRTVNELLRERRGVTPRMALFMSRFFGISPEFWLNAQRNIDLWDALPRYRNKIVRIIPVNLPGTCKGNDRYWRGETVAGEHDAAIIERHAKRLNMEAREVLDYQVPLSSMELSYKAKAMDEELSAMLSEWKEGLTRKSKDRHARLARECAKCDPREERAMAEEGMVTSPHAAKPRQGWAKRIRDAIRKENADEYLEKRAAKGSRSGFERALKKVRDAKPARKDAL